MTKEKGKKGPVTPYKSAPAQQITTTTEQTPHNTSGYKKQALLGVVGLGLGAVFPAAQQVMRATSLLQQPIAPVTPPPPFLFSATPATYAHAPDNRSLRGNGVKYAPVPEVTTPFTPVLGTTSVTLPENQEGTIWVFAKLPKNEGKDFTVKIASGDTTMSVHYVGGIATINTAVGAQHAVTAPGRSNYSPTVISGGNFDYLALLVFLDPTQGIGLGDPGVLEIDRPMHGGGGSYYDDKYYGDETTPFLLTDMLTGPALKDAEQGDIKPVIQFFTDNPQDKPGKKSPGPGLYPQWLGDDPYVPDEEVEHISREVNVSVDSNSKEINFYIAGNWPGFNPTNPVTASPTKKPTETPTETPTKKIPQDAKSNSPTKKPTKPTKPTKEPIPKKKPNKKRHRHKG